MSSREQFPSRSARQYLDRAGAVPRSPLRRGFRRTEVVNLADVRKRNLAKLIASAEAALVEVDHEIDSLEVIRTVSRRRTMHGATSAQIVGAEMLDQLIRVRRRSLRD